MPDEVAQRALVSLCTRLQALAKILSPVLKVFFSAIGRIASYCFHTKLQVAQVPMPLKLSATRTHKVLPRVKSLQ